ncbi:MAG: sugar ABC transporter substrate-binding protein [Firmicutes bacterium]|nr:sugar ABC transporter substrate-binding protein [Bacillota bacterium]
MKKLLLCLLLVLVLSAQVLAADYKIGFNNALSGVYCLDILENFAVYCAEALGVELMVVNDEGKIEKSIANVENLIASGVDGIIYFGMSDATFAIVSKMCADAGVPFVLYDHLPTAETLAHLRSNPYFAGAVGEDDYDAGYPIGRFAGAVGAKTAVLVTGNRGDTTHEARVQGFTDAFAEVGGQVLDVAWGAIASRADALKKSEDLLVAYPDVDAVYTTSGAGAVSTMEVLQKYDDLDPLFFVTDLDPEILEGLQAGQVTAANGAHWINSGLAVALLHNFLEGNPLKDANGQAPVFHVPIIVLQANQYYAYEEQWLQNMPFSPDEIRQLSSKYNPAASAELFENLLANYSVEQRVRDKYEAGVITAEDLERYGF